MATEWIRAALALRIVARAFGNGTARSSIIRRANGGLIPTRTTRLVVDNEKQDGDPIPAGFWPTRGQLTVEDWDSGDFGSLLERGEQWRAFAVEFGFDEVMDLVPPEQRVTSLAESTVASDVGWVRARNARHLVWNGGTVATSRIGAALLEECKLGFLIGRAVLAQWYVGSGKPNWHESVREWDIPVWFWKDFSRDESSEQDWDLGRFTGVGVHEGKRTAISLSGVHFLKSSLGNLVPSLRATITEEGDGEDRPHKPRSPDARLEAWWSRKAAVRDQLSLEELLNLGRGASPDYSGSHSHLSPT